MFIFLEIVPNNDINLVEKKRNVERNNIESAVNAVGRSLVEMKNIESTKY
jgi:NACalpha-BTF3-like transcription factor